MNIERLGSLTAGTINPALSGGHSSSRDKLIGVECAGDLAGLIPVEMAYIAAKYMGDEASVSAVLIATRKQAVNLAVKNRWKVSPSKLLILADIATHEALSSCRCKRCLGTGYKVNKVCLSCGGSGLGHESTVAMARAVGVDESVYRRCWKEKLVHMLAFLYDIERSIRLKLALRNNNWTTAEI
jgi:hypothetical protein